MPSASRVAWLPMMLVIASTRAPWPRACLMAASVSAVSPDWEMPTTSVVGDSTGSVAELGRHVQLHRYPRPVLQQITADQPGMVGGAAGDDINVVDLRQLLVRDGQLLEDDAATGRSRPARVSVSESGCS